MLNINDFPLTALSRNEMEQTHGGGWGEFFLRLLISEFDDMNRGMQDAISGNGYHYK